MLSPWRRQRRQRLPIVFMSADSDAEYPGARSMQAAQKFAAPNMVKPAARAIMGNAIAVS